MKNKAPKNEASMSNDTRIALLEQSIGHINETLIRFEKRFDQLDNKIDSKIDSLDKKIDSLDKKHEMNFRDLNNRLWLNFFWTVSAFAGILTLIGRSFHWI